MYDQPLAMWHPDACSTFGPIPTLQVTVSGTGTPFGPFNTFLLKPLTEKFLESLNITSPSLDQSSPPLIQTENCPQQSSARPTFESVGTPISALSRSFDAVPMFNKNRHFSYETHTDSILPSTLPPTSYPMPTTRRLAHNQSHQAEREPEKKAFDSEECGLKQENTRLEGLYGPMSASRLPHPKSSPANSTFILPASILQRSSVPADVIVSGEENTTTEQNYFAENRLITMLCKDRPTSPVQRDYRSKFSPIRRRGPSDEHPTPHCEPQNSENWWKNAQSSDDASSRSSASVSLSF